MLEEEQYDWLRNHYINISNFFRNQTKKYIEVCENEKNKSSV